MKKVYGIKYKDREGKVILNMLLFETKEKAEQYMREEFFQKTVRLNKWKDLKIVGFPLR